MARSVNEIFNSILTAVQNNSVLDTNLTSVSQVAIYRQWIYEMSTALATEEVLNDVFIADAESAISSNPPANVPWVQRYVAAFQYSATVPQVGQIDTTTLIYGYPVVDNNLKILTRISIVNPYINNIGSVVGTPGVVLVKVAKGSTPVALSGTELTALQNYLNILKPAGVIYKAISVAADRLFCEVKIYYQGSYASVIKANVYAAYLNYIANVPFDGVMKVSDLEVVLRGVVGVTDMVFINMNYRRNTIAFSTTYNMIAAQLLIRKDSSDVALAGYINDEDTSGYSFLTINDSNFISN